MSLVATPLAADGRGRTAETDIAGHVAGMLERLLFTAPGERVMRPNFGTGLQELVFAPGSDELAAATRFLVEGAIQQWLGARIAVERLETAFEDGTLSVAITYSVTATGERRTVNLERPM